MKFSINGPYTPCMCLSLTILDTESNPLLISEIVNTTNIFAHIHTRNALAFIESGPFLNDLIIRSKLEIA